MSNEAMQAFYNEAEALADSLDGAEGCTGALLVLLAQIEREMPELMQQASAVTGAINLYLKDARSHADRIARCAMARPER